MDFGHWFSDQLQVSADGLLWGIEQVPPERRDSVAPGRLGTWTATHHVIHRVYNASSDHLGIEGSALGGK
jgi:hypothetical protein